MFGVNRFSLRTHFPVRVDSTLVDGQWRYDTTYRQVPDFRLVSQNGASFTAKELEGKIYVANFFYTSCAANCKQMSTQLSRVQDAFRLKPNVKILSFSLRPEEDSPEVLKRYAESFRANPYKWVFLTGSSAEILRLAQQGYNLQTTDSVSTGKAEPVSPQNLYLVDQQKHVRGIYDGTSAADVDRLITEINVLLSEDNTDNGKQSPR
ncbi:SCO family protein [Rufibacter latericius]